MLKQTDYALHIIALAGGWIDAADVVKELKHRHAHATNIAETMRLLVEKNLIDKRRTSRVMYKINSNGLERIREGFYKYVSQY